MKIYLDDHRSAPPGWQRTYTAEETVELLDSHDVEAVNLDGHIDGAFTGLYVLEYIEKRMTEDPTWRVPAIDIHADPSSVRSQMEEAWLRIEAKRAHRSDAVQIQVTIPRAADGSRPFDVAGHSRPDPRKKRGGDAYGARSVEDGGEVALAIADGVGSRPCDWKASATAVDHSLTLLATRTDLDPEGRLRVAVEGAAKAVQAIEGDCAGALSTLVLAVYSPDPAVVHWTSIGDSRAYLHRPGALQQLSADDSVSEKRIEQDGTVRSVDPITRAIGQSATLDVQVTATEVPPGAAFVLATDGAYGAGFSGGLDALDRRANIIDGLRPCLFDDRAEWFDDDASIVVLRREALDEATRQRHVKALLEGDGEGPIHGHLLFRVAMGEVLEASRGPDRDHALRVLDRVKERHLRGEPDVVQATLRNLDERCHKTFGRVADRLMQLANG